MISRFALLAKQVIFASWRTTAKLIVELSMTSKSLRYFVAIGWAGAGLMIWATPCNMFVYTLESMEQWGVRVPSNVHLVYSVIAFAGIFVIPPWVAVIALRGKLPFTVAGNEDTSRGCNQ